MNELLFVCIIVYMVLLYYVYNNNMRKMPLIKPIQVWWANRFKFGQDIILTKKPQLIIYYEDCLSYISDYLRVLNVQKEFEQKESVIFCYDPFNKELLVSDPTYVDLTHGFLKFVEGFRRRYKREKITVHEYNKYVQVRFIVEQHFVQLENQINKIVEDKVDTMIENKTDKVVVEDKENEVVNE